MSVSVLILTHNEESNLPRCLDALTWCDDIVVVDSGSTDATIDIANHAGARVVHRAFDDFASQRNYALDHVDFQHDWILHLDADEVCTDALHDGILEKILDTRFAAYRIPSKTMFLGRWLRFAGMYPTYQVRLGRSPEFRFKQVGHGQQEDIDPSRVGTLNEPYLHYSFSRGVEAWFDKVNRYTSQEAQHAWSSRNGKRIALGPRTWHDPVMRRRALKQFSYCVPNRPVLRFLYMYFLRLGFLDGLAGLQYCRMLATYEFMIDMKLHEKQQRGVGRDL